MAEEGFGAKVRVVRCPKCEKLLPELADFLVYRCGGCGTTLQAKKAVPGMGASPEKSDGENIKYLEVLQHNTEKKGIASNASTEADHEVGRAESRIKESLPHGKSMTEAEDSGLMNKLITSKLDSIPMENGTDTQNVTALGKPEIESGRDTKQQNPSHVYGNGAGGSRQNMDDASKVGYLEQDRAKLLRMLDELRDQVQQTCEASDKKKTSAPVDRMAEGCSDLTWGPLRSSGDFTRSSLPYREHFGYSLSDEAADGSGNGSGSKRSIMYDYRAGFWGVMGHPCLGIIPPFIEEFNYPMPKNCAGGNTGVLVNGRELHQKDLDLLIGRGLPATRDCSYIIEISGKVWDESSGEEIESLGKLAPTALVCVALAAFRCSSFSFPRLLYSLTFGLRFRCGSHRPLPRPTPLLRRFSCRCSALLWLPEEVHVERGMGMDWEPWPPLQRKSNHVFVKLLVLVLLLGLSFRLLFSRSAVFLPVSESPAAVAETASSTAVVVGVVGDAELRKGSPLTDSAAPVTEVVVEDGEASQQGGYLFWRWKPHGCDVPTFNAEKFLNAMRNKSWALIGDSILRNHAQSLICLLSKAEEAVEVYHADQYKSRRWLFPSHNFTVSLIWTPFLIKAEIFENDDGESKSENRLHIDTLDKKWTSQYNNFDYVVISGGQWFLKTAIYMENNTVIGCHYCPKLNMSEVSLEYAYGRILNYVYNFVTTSGHKPVVIYRTWTPDHFEYGEWFSGVCNRTVPYKMGEFNGSNVDHVMRKIELEEFRRAVAAEGSETVAHLKLLDTYQLSWLRPDAHPGPYRKFHPFDKDKNAKVQNDCLHWGLPRAIDTWNDLIMELILGE
ncbi:hypothetical protein MUK42_21516 [Musa troglodytarum]|uniref:Uncharacterized protein n=1 Tax=Musa troglodytarum TaxID=320322 RepID=A0A9E7L5V6_9LILI|nr:hypothetical protein MUK42_21516 [Musa troglodytarum]URE45397.1 hypothetical protein MUK42_21516 [Musa troglodytarum]